MTGLLEKIRAHRGLTGDPFIIGITGYGRSGKDTVADILRAELHAQTSWRCILKVSLAENLKHTLGFLCDDLGFTNDDSKGKRCVNFPDHTYREVMISFGDWARSLHEDIFVDLLREDLQKYPGTSVAIVPDVRRLNEVKLCGALIRVTCPGVKPAANHATEGELDDYPVDYTLENSSLELREKNPQLALERLKLRTQAIL